MTASTDNKFSNYYSEVRLQLRNDDVIQDMRELTIDCLIEYYKANNALKPEKIILFRYDIPKSKYQKVSVLKSVFNLDIHSKW